METLELRKNDAEPAVATDHTEAQNQDGIASAVAQSAGVHAQLAKDTTAPAPPVQMQSSAALQSMESHGAGGAKRVRQTAVAGVSGASQQLPHLSQIQQSFGSHDVSNVQVGVGGEAATASEAIGAEAYAVDNKLGFRSSPNLHTAAHEAAHVVQQRGGVQLKDGVGQQGDHYERQADAVADRVVRGQSAEALLDQTSSPKGEGTASKAGNVQKIAVIKRTVYSNDFSKFAVDLQAAAEEDEALGEMFEEFMDDADTSAVEDFGGIEAVLELVMKAPVFCTSWKQVVGLAHHMVDMIDAAASKGSPIDKRDLTKIGQGISLAQFDADSSAAPVWDPVQMREVKSATDTVTRLYTGGFAGCLGLVLLGSPVRGIYQFRALAHVYSGFILTPDGNWANYGDYMSLVGKASKAYIVWDSKTIGKERVAEITELYGLQGCDVQTLMYVNGIFVYPDGTTSVTTPSDFG